ncbi:hypothetical protein A5656_30500 [Mycobacterium gordonae]|nr:hypothetical protein A5656_30500 [Mycobacterium gordonae]
MEQFDGLRPARLKVGIISAGRVGSALGVALERADHVVVACSAFSQASLQRAQRRLPDTPVLSPPDVAAGAELLLLAVTDSELSDTEIPVLRRMPRARTAATVLGPGLVRSCSDRVGVRFVGVVPVASPASFRLRAGRGCRSLGRRPVAARRARWQPLPLGRGRLPGHRLGLWLGLGLWLRLRLRLGWRRRLVLRLRLELRRWRWPVPWLEGPGLLRRRGVLTDVGGLPRWQQRFLGNVDDRCFLFAGGLFLRLLLTDGGDPIAGHPVGGRAFTVRGGAGRPIGQRPRRFPVQSLEGRTVFEVGIEQDLQVGPQRGQFRPQRRDLIGRLSPYFRGQFAAQLRLHRQLVLAACRDFAVQLQVVHQLHVPGARLVGLGLAAVQHRHEGAGHGGPQRQDHSELEKFHPIGENQRGTGRDCQDQQRRQEHPPRPAAAAPDPGAAGQNGHGP